MVDPERKPVEGVAVRHLFKRGFEHYWHHAELTDKNGVARLHVERNAVITFGAMSPNSLPKYVHEYFEQRIDGKTENSPPEKPFQIQLTEAQMKILSELPESQRPTRIGDRP